MYHISKSVVLKNYAWLVLAESVGKGSILFFTLYIARLFGPESFGDWSLAMSIAVIVATMSDFGLNTMTVRDIAQNLPQAQKHFNMMLSAKLLFNSVLLLLMAVLSFVLFYNNVNIAWLILLLGSYAIINSFVHFLQSIFRAYEKMQYEALSKIVQGILLIVLGVASLTYIGDTLALAAWAFPLTALISLLITTILVAKRFVHISLSLNYYQLKKVLTKALPFAFIGILGMIHYQVDTIQVYLLSTTTQTGLYAAAFNIIFVLMSIIVLFHQSLYPNVSKLFIKSPKTFFKKISSLAPKISLFSLAIFTGVFISAQPTIILLYGTAYQASVPILRILTISFFVLLLNTIYSIGLLVMGKQSRYAVLYFIGILINIILNFFTIPLWGGLGAASSTLLSSTIITGLFIYQFHQLKRRAATEYVQE